MGKKETVFKLSLNIQTTRGSTRPSRDRVLYMIGDNCITNISRTSVDKVMLCQPFPCPAVAP